MSKVLYLPVNFCWCVEGFLPGKLYTNKADAEGELKGLARGIGNECHCDHECYCDVVELPLEDLDGSNLIDSVVNVGDIALEKFGESAQINMAIEEMGELIVELSRNSRGRSNWDKINEECADVLITVIQMAKMFGGTTLLNHNIQQKLHRLKLRCT